MAEIAKVSKETKKHQYLQKVYKKPEAKEKKVVNQPKKVEEKTERKPFFTKEVIKSIIIFLVIGLISSAGYLIARFVQF